jgi:hypothetical protein
MASLPAALVDYEARRPRSDIPVRREIGRESCADPTEARAQPVYSMWSGEGARLLRPIYRTLYALPQMADLLKIAEIIIDHVQFAPPEPARHCNRNWQSDHMR